MTTVNWKVSQRRTGHSVKKADDDIAQQVRMYNAFPFSPDLGMSVSCPEYPVS